MATQDTSNRARFRGALIIAYADLFANDPEYAYSASRCTPEGLADKMIAGLANGSANKDGKGIARACRSVGIKPTWKELRSFLHEKG